MLVSAFFPLLYPHPHLFFKKIIKHDKTSILLSSLKFKVALLTDFWERECLNLWIIPLSFRVYAN